jgi:hypothetical protein
MKNTDYILDGKKKVPYLEDRMLQFKLEIKEMKKYLHENKENHHKDVICFKRFL